MKNILLATTLAFAALVSVPAYAQNSDTCQKLAAADSVAGGANARLAAADLKPCP